MFPIILFKSLYIAALCTAVYISWIVPNLEHEVIVLWIAILFNTVVDLTMALRKEK